MRTTLPMEPIDKNQTIDETKRKLKASREQLEGELEVQLQDIKRDASGFAKKVLLYGGGIYLSYRLIKSLTTNKEEKTRKKKRKKYAQKKQKSSGIGSMIAHQLLALAAMAAKEAITESFKQKKNTHDRKQHS